MSDKYRIISFIGYRGADMRFKTVIFDLDGTLLNTLEDIGESANQCLAEYGFPAYPIGDYREFVGDGARNLIIRATNGNAEEPIIDEIVIKYKRLYEERYDVKTVKYSGIDALLSWLDEMGIPYSVLSNKTQSASEKIIRRYFPLNSFFSISGQRDGIPIKPDPAQAIRIINELRCDPRDAVFIGDSRTDMDTAKNAGMFALGVLWGFRDKAELLSHGADAVAETPLDVIQIMNTQRLRDIPRDIPRV